MSDTTVTETPAAGPADRYLDEVRQHLAGLSDDERDELLEDLAAHLREVAADDPRPLEETLGPPSQFAAEMLASAGLEGRAAGGRADGLARLSARVRRARDHEWTRAVVAFLPELRPAWWVLRAHLIVLGVSALLADGFHDLSAFPVPSMGSPIVGLVALAAAIVVSVRLGRSSGAPGATGAVGRFRTSGRLVNGLAVVLALVALGHLHDGLDAGDADIIAPAYADDPGLALGPSSGMIRTDGTPITNIYAYDRHGELMHDVLLYDQAGQPIDLGEVFNDPVTGVELVTDYPVDANGVQIRNAFPLDQRAAEWDDTGVRRERAVPPPAVVVPPPSSTTTTTRP